jgi:hypothetical protein
MHLKNQNTSNPLLAFLYKLSNEPGVDDEIYPGRAGQGVSFIGMWVQTEPNRAR